MKKIKNKKLNKKVLLEVRDLTKKFRIGEKVRSIFEKINFTVFEGELIAIFGRSGAGKTLLMQILTGLEEIEGGTIYFKDKNYEELNNTEKADLLKKSYSILLREGNLVDYLNVSENITLLKNTRECDQKYLEKVNEIINIQEILSEKIPLLNWLDYQKVSLLVVLSSNPDIIFMDEPTGNMSESGSTQFMEVIKRINKELNQTFIIFTHDSKIALEINKVVRV